MKTIKILFFLVIVILTSCENSHELLENDINIGTAINLGYEFDLVRDPLKSSVACKTQQNKFWIDSTQFSTATHIYSTCDGTLATDGWYSDGLISRYWDNDQGGTLFEYVSCTPASRTSIKMAYESDLRRDPVKAYIAFEDYTTYFDILSTFWINSTQFSTATQIYSTYNGTLATDGWYSDGVIARYWDTEQGGELFEAISCKTIGTAINLGYEPDLRRDINKAYLACEAAPVLSTFWIDSTQFSTATRIYSTFNGTLATDGWYSDGVIARYWDNDQGGTLFEYVSCKPTTTTTTKLK